jgi:hypothetical protein
VIDHFPPAGQWKDAPGAKASNAAREFARFMDRRLLRSDEPIDLVAAACPAELAAQAVVAARVQAAQWAALADALSRPRLETAR